MNIFESKDITFETKQSISVFSSFMESQSNNIGNDGGELVSLVYTPHSGIRRYNLEETSNNILAVLKCEQRESVNK